MPRAASLCPYGGIGAVLLPCCPERHWEATSRSQGSVSVEEVNRLPGAPRTRPLCRAGVQPCLEDPGGSTASAGVTCLAQTSLPCPRGPPLLSSSSVAQHLPPGPPCGCWVSGSFAVAEPGWGGLSGECCCAGGGGQCGRGAAGPATKVTGGLERQERRLQAGTKSLPSRLCWPGSRGLAS